MATRVADEYATRAAGWVQTIILRDEELHPLPEDGSAGMRIARVTERLAQASLAVQCYEESARRPRDGEADGDDAGLLHAGIYLLGAAAFAISAVPWFLPHDSTATQLKDALVDELDEEVDACQTEHNGMYATATAQVWPVTALSRLVGACEGVCGLEGLPALCSLDEEDEEEVDADDDDELDILESLATEIADSLTETAHIAGAGGQWCIERYEEVQTAAKQPARTGRGRRRR